MQSTGIFFSGWMEFNASRILKIEKKRNGGRKSRWQVEGGFLDIWKEGGCPWVVGKLATTEQPIRSQPERSCATSPNTVSVSHD